MFTCSLRQNVCVTKLASNRFVLQFKLMLVGFGEEIGEVSRFDITKGQNSQVKGLSQ